MDTGDLVRGVRLPLSHRRSVSTWPGPAGDLGVILAVFTGLGARSRASFISCRSAAARVAKSGTEDVPRAAKTAPPRIVALTIVVLLPAGVAWIVVIAGLNSAAQAFLPAWVRARALSIYQIVLFTSSALGAALWGVVAQWAGLVTAFVLAGAALAVAAASARRWPLITPLAADRRAISYWPDPPDLAESDTGPVLVVVRYQVPEQRRAAFLRAPDLVLH
jgi:hypothetical protein